MNVPLGKSIIFCLFLVFCVFLLQKTGLTAPLERTLAPFISGQMSVVRNATLSLHRLFWCTDCIRVAEYDELRTRGQDLMVENTRLLFYRLENEELRKELQFSKRTAQKTLSAHVIGKDPRAERSIILIDKGSQDGIIKHAPVISGDGIFVGTILEIRETFSSVILLSDSMSKITASLLGDVPIHGVVQGQFNLGLVMRFIPIDKDIKEGMRVTTSGMEQTIPGGLLVGTVSGIEKKPSDLFQSAVLAPAVSYNNLRIVSILLL